MRVLLALLATAGLGVLLRLLVIGAGPTSGPELFEYDTLARNLLAGGGYTYPHLGTTYRSLYPGIFYVGLTAGVYAAFPPGYLAMLVVQALTCGLLAVVVFRIGRELWSRSAGLLAAGLAVTHPGLLYYDTHKLHPLGFDALMTSLAVLSLLWARRSRARLAPWLAGAVLGIAALQRGGLWGLLPFGGAWLGVGHGSVGWRRWRVFGYVMGVVLIVAPWVVRNYRIHGRPLLATTTAELFWRGNAPQAAGASLLASGESVLQAAPEAFHAELLARDELGQARLFWEAGLARARDDPRAFLSGVARKFLYFWTWGPRVGLRYPPTYAALYKLYYVAVGLFALAGMVALGRGVPGRPAARSGLLLIAAALLSMSLTHSLLYVELRHRWAVEPLLLVLCAIGWLSVADRLRLGRRWIRSMTA